MDEQHDLAPNKPKGLRLFIRPLLLVAGLLSLPFLLTMHKSPLGLTFLVLLVIAGVVTHLIKQRLKNAAPVSSAELSTADSQSYASSHAAETSTAELAARDKHNMEQFETELIAANAKPSLLHILLSPFYFILGLMFIGAIVAMGGAAYVLLILGTLLPLAIVLWQRHKQGRSTRSLQELNLAYKEMLAKMAVIQRHSPNSNNTASRSDHTLLNTAEYVIWFLLACILMRYLNDAMLWLFTNGIAKNSAQNFLFQVLSFFLAFIFTQPYIHIQQDFHPHKTRLRIVINISLVAAMVLWLLF